MNTLEEYGNLFTKLGLTEMSVKEGDFELVLKKGTDLGKVDAALNNNVTYENTVKNVNTKEEAFSDSVMEINSPLVGVFYAGESPDASPYVKVGDIVKKGDVICVIEAMKMFNDVVADKDGVIKEICVENGQLVEFKQPLFKLTGAGEI